MELLPPKLNGTATWPKTCPAHAEELARRDFSPSAASGKPPVVRGVVHEVEKDDRPVRDGVKASVKRGKVDAIEVRNTVLLAKVAGDGVSRDHFAPPGVASESG
jgi:hypothetical protein